MPGIPAWCSACGRSFESQLHLRSGQAGRLQIEGVGEVCPHCGYRADVLDGTWDAATGVIRLLEGPQWSRERLVDLHRAVKAAPTIADAWRTVESQAPEVASQIREAMPSKTILDWVAVIVAVLSLWAQLTSPTPVTADELREVLDQVISEGVQQEQQDPPGHRLPPQT